MTGGISQFVRAYESVAADTPSAAHTAPDVFRAVMIANGNPDPGTAAAGMLENCCPDDREFIETLTGALAALNGGAA